MNAYRSIVVAMMETKASRKNWIATQQRLAKRVVRAISLAIPSVEPEIMQAHTRYCMQFIEEWNMTFPEAKRVREYIGR